jgi:hypothetical protein
MDRPPLEPAEPPRWHGDLDDDCTAEWAGLMLRAEQLDVGCWWWCVYDLEMGKQVVASQVVLEPCTSGTQARHAAEQAARAYLDVKDRRCHWRPKNKKVRGRTSPYQHLKRISLSEAMWRKRRGRRR